jgi:hypothetical protein
VIRRATAADLPWLVALGAQFHAEPRWPAPLTFNPDDFAETCARLLEAGVIFLSERGLIGLMVSPSIYNHSVTVASELFFWAPDGQGDALRRAAEQWASEHADVLVMGAHEPGPVERISNWYRRKGYVPIGRQFARAV